MPYPGDDDQNLEAEDTVEESWEEEGQLSLADEDEDLPWLEADEYEEEGGFDWRLLWTALIGLLVVGAALGAIWWFNRDAPDPELVADGSTIEAPEGAYKQRPEDSGGTEVAGTGDQAFEVAEGESTRGRMAGEDADSEARPSINASQAASSATPAASASSSSSDTAGAVYIQIGAFGSRADAESAWSTESRNHSALSGMRHRVVEGDVNGAKVYRLQAIAADRSSADATCRSIRNSGGDCYIR